MSAFVDAVLAIILTILVLELECPDSLTVEGFWALRNNFFASLAKVVYSLIV
nr:TMEM175 family protein [Streptococcus moroccensis]